MTEADTIIETAIITHLKQQSNISTLISNRIYPLELPQPIEGWPSITYSCVSRAPTRDLSGVTYFTSRFQFSCWSDRYLDAKNTAKAVRTALDGYGNKDIGTFRVLDATIANETDMSLPDSGLFHVPVDILMKHK